jgi:polar amino acid transport system substrate-binding protein
MSNRHLPRLAGTHSGRLGHDRKPRERRCPEGRNRADRKAAGAIAISPAGGAFWSTRNEAGGDAGVPVDPGKEMAAQLGVPVEYLAYRNSRQIVDAVSTGAWDVSFLPQDPEREARMSFGPVYEVSDATYIVKAGLIGDQFRNARSARRQDRRRQ